MPYKSTITESKGFLIKSESGREQYADCIETANKKKRYMAKNERRNGIIAEIEISELNGYLVECGDNYIFTPSLSYAKKKAKEFEAKEIKKEREIEKQSHNLIGERFKFAREELCGMSLSRAALMLGMSVGNLSKIEHYMDKRLPSVEVVARASKIYDVSCDYLLGLNDDWERDPKAYQEKSISTWIFSELEAIKVQELNAIRLLNDKVIPISEASQHAISSSIEIKETLDSIREKNPLFDEEISGGAKLVRLVNEYHLLSTSLLAQLKRVNFFKDAVKKQTGLNLDVFKVVK